MDNKLVPTICLIDDDQILQFLFEEIIKLYNIADRSLIFSDGSDAFDFFKENLDKAEQLPDLVILDLNMPHMDGWDFLDEYAKIKSSLAKLPIIYIMSSSTHPSDQAKAKTCSEISGYIIKPIDGEKLLQVAQEATVQKQDKAS